VRGGLCRPLGQDDWSFDTQGSDVLTRAEFFESMFTFADNWTHTTDEEEYPFARLIR
jgi:hypothetical protein